jgi:hypothetical protein
MLACVLAAAFAKPVEIGERVDVRKPDRLDLRAQRTPIDSECAAANCASLAELFA